MARRVKGLGLSAWGFGGLGSGLGLKCRVSSLVWLRQWLPFLRICVRFGCVPQVLCLISWHVNVGVQTATVFLNHAGSCVCV